MSALGRQNSPASVPLALPGIDLTALVDAVAERLAVKLRAGTAPTQANGDEPLLLTIEQTAKKLGRTVSATEHLVRAGTLKAVRIDRRVRIDYRDILMLIEQSKGTRDAKA
jgi:excisionase family DNA binding protein